MSEDLWRVDVAGYTVFVKGQNAKEHLEAISQNYSKMKMGLYRIAHKCKEEIKDGDLLIAQIDVIAREALGSWYVIEDGKHQNIS